MDETIQFIQSQQMSTKAAITFPMRLLQILSDESNSQSISWERDGRSFSIRDLKNFQTVLLPAYFRHSRFQSFVRQLNMYGFHKMRNNKPGELLFQNPRFYRGNPDNHLVSRKQSNTKDGKRKSASTTASQLQLDRSSPEELVASLPSESHIDQSFSQMEKVDSDSELITDLLEQIRRKELLLDCDIEAEVEALLQVEPYNCIHRKFLPWILEQLGVEDTFSHRNLFKQLSFRTEELLAIDPQQPSMKLII